jgi:hypothetical protein
LSTKASKSEGNTLVGFSTKQWSSTDEKEAQGEEFDRMMMRKRRRLTRHGAVKIQRKASPARQRKDSCQIITGGLERQQEFDEVMNERTQVNGQLCLGCGRSGVVGDNEKNTKRREKSHVPISDGRLETTASNH